MLIIRTTDATYTISGIKELAGQVVYLPNDIEPVVERDDLSRL